jgi:thiol-disulfide isomerase/thioredoxin
MKLPIPWISANSYYSGMKKNGNQKIYFDFNVFLYNIGYNLNKVIISKSPITRNNLNINDTIYSGDYFKLKNKVYHIDSISDKKQLAYISLNKTNINSVLGKSKSNIFNPIKKDSLLCITGIQTNLAEVFANNADSLFLIDIWASWCEPCRKEMPISKALSKKYIGSKIKFIYLSVDNNKDSWEKACNEEDLINSNSFLLTNSWNSNFIKKNNIFSIPRYILIGRNGRVISIDAPELNDSKLRKLIDNSLLD